MITPLLSLDTLHWWELPAAFVLDALAGDPRHLPHPVRWMGRAIEVAEPIFRRMFENERVAGLLFAVCLIVSTWALAALVTGVAYAVHPLAGSLTQVLMIYYCLSARSRERAGGIG